METYGDDEESLKQYIDTLPNKCTVEVVEAFRSPSTGREHVKTDIFRAGFDSLSPLTKHLTGEVREDAGAFSSKK